MLVNWFGCHLMIFPVKKEAVGVKRFYLARVIVYVLKLLFFRKKRKKRGGGLHEEPSVVPKLHSIYRGLHVIEYVKKYYHLCH